MFEKVENGGASSQAGVVVVQYDPSIFSTLIKQTLGEEGNKAGHSGAIPSPLCLYWVANAKDPVDFNWIISQN